MSIQTNFWVEHILTDAVQANLDRIGRGAIFEDSLIIARGDTTKPETPQISAALSARPLLVNAMRSAKR